MGVALRSGESVSTALTSTACGTLYHPEFEWYGNYVPTVLPRRYDALIYIDESSALGPLHLRPRMHEEAPETFPTGA